MVAWKLSSLLLLSLRALNAFAEIQVSRPPHHGAYTDLLCQVEKVEEVVNAEPETPNLKVKVSASFPQSEIFGVKLINGHATKALFSFTNEELEPVGVTIIGGSLLQDAAPNAQVLRNLTAKKYSVEIPAGAEQTVPYSFSTEMHPQDLRLQLIAVLKDHKGVFHTVSVYNETISIVEPPTSIFDPQIIFLYIVLLGAFAGTLYFIYSTWISTLFPQKKRGGKGGERAKRSSLGTKKVDPAEQVAVVGADGPAVTGSKVYDSNWIPAAHLQRPEAKRVRSGTPKSLKKS
ncbi:hypothetical protein K504DRAFT_392239 [Pleomassaria siparia CBS 279.74]|uniref:Uncharacterized protein n=1 Tax=Pleomassaria siparia CBS 279.74 TaxID=1314801 RepID=A0A6G1JSF9_9PLEO|nr:hypothetical protein K504DRAFT_392239 [Pleomassaria siparia CBS 279.74]